MKNNLYWIALLGFISVIPSCKPESEHDHAHDIITTLKVNVKDSSNVQLLGTYRFADTDGDGGQAPTADTLWLEAGKTYRVGLELLDESAGKNLNLTAAIQQEGKDHLFVTTGSPWIAAELLDRDENGLPLGFDNRWVAGGAGSGSMMIRLKHQPGVKDGSAAPGDTDLEAVFPVVVR